AERGRLLRPIRGRARTPHRSKSTYRDKPQEQWIHIRVPAIVSPEVFAAAHRQLERNRRLSQRNARGERYLLQGLVVCARCGYAYYGKTVSKSAAKGGRRYAYYRCVGTDAFRFAGGRVCTNGQVRADQLDDYVWESVQHVLEDPDRVIQEWTRRSASDRGRDERRAQRDEAAKVLASHERSHKRLLDAYEAGALDLKELTERIERLRPRIQRAREELNKAEQRLTEIVTLRAVSGRLEDFATRVRHGLERLSWHERRQLIRALVARVEIDDEGATVVYRVPSTAPSPEPDGERPASSAEGPPSGIHLRERRGVPTLRRPLPHLAQLAVLHDACVQQLHQQPHHAPVRDPVLDELLHPPVVDGVEERPDVCVEHPVHLPADRFRKRVQRIVRRPARPEAVREALEFALVDGLQHHPHRLLDDLVLQRRDAERARATIAFRDVHAPHRLRVVAASMDPVLEIEQAGFEM